MSEMKQAGDHAHTNRLINETSPYLLQHAHNPVDWYPWGEEALATAREQNKPILLSVGYSACHWCHVMERESFENSEIAAMMNKLFVNIKVDREERPDIDSIYMDAVVAMTGHGGWPMTVFLTPDGTPFYGGTYFPPVRKYGNMPSFPEVLEAVADAYVNRPEDILTNTTQMREALNRSNDLERDGSDELKPELLDYAWSVQIQTQPGRASNRGLAYLFDAKQGGVGQAPKFPQPMALDYTLRFWQRTRNEQARNVLELTLRKMAWGGMYDQLGGGFHRYSTDSKWLVPHFEKMLYDNSQLSLLYLHAYQAFGNAEYKRVAVETLDYILREMTMPEGGFYSTQDADSEGEEGKFFVWTLPEIETALGAEDAAVFAKYYDVTTRGNWEGHNILHIMGTPEEIAGEADVTVEQLHEVIERGKRTLYELREKRVHPERDDKILVSWNGMMLKSFAAAARILDRDDYRDVALKNAEFILNTLRTPEGRFYRTYKDGKAHLNGFLEDYALYADGLLALYEATFDARWLNEAVKIADALVENFWEESEQCFYDTSRDHEQLVVRPRSLDDNATPSGNSVAVDVLLRLALLTGDPAEKYRPKAVKALAKLAATAALNPSGFGRMLGALDFHLGNPPEIVIVGDESDPATRALLDVIFKNYLPNRVIMLANGDPALANNPLVEGRTRRDGKPTAYVCRNYACQQPVTDPAALASQLGIKID
jgi:uncharacterized protein